MRIALTAFLVVIAAGSAASSAAITGHTYVPASQSEVQAGRGASALPEGELERYLANLTQTHVFDAFDGMNEALKAASATHEPLRVARTFPVEVGPDMLFGKPFADGAWQVHQTVITSVDAEALRLRVDLASLDAQAEVYVIDLLGARAFGPYTFADHVEGGRWLPTTVGDTAVLLVRTTSASAPLVRLIELAHFYWDFSELKELSCNVDAACETDPTIQELSSGVGVLVIPYGGGEFAICSGCLLENADTPEQEPYFLTANHCIATAMDAVQTDVIWDFRTSACDADDAPSFSALPHSDVADLLETSSRLDATLLLLGDVPVGDYGRAYLGWDTREPAVGESIIGLHYPQGTYLRISHGRVEAIDQVVYSGGLDVYRRQTRVVWDEGVTEPGSSGSCLLFDDGTYGVLGALSNGEQHTCGEDRSGNIDNYASFRDFFPSVEGYLTGTTPPRPRRCPARRVFKDRPEVLAGLRAFRDKGLRSSGLGVLAIAAYYDAAPYLVDVVEASPAARVLFIGAATPFAAVGRALP
ncbi:MAG TPA: hypothetical protein HPP83_03925 [Candidatus Hydrogenedentes bacterium]|nr:hypothetical protein [Candidatus Hydrogenedentota bacterium]